MPRRTLLPGPSEGFVHPLPARTLRCNETLGWERLGTLGAVRAVLIGNAGRSDSGFVGNRLRERGFTFTEGQREHPADWPALDGIELVLTLGSEWNVYRPETGRRWSRPRRRWCATSSTRGIPLLGICFGAQVLAHALGGVVSRAPAPEIGWVTVAVDGPPVAAGPWMEWHDDVFTAPRRLRRPRPQRRRTAADPRPPHGRDAVPPRGHRDDGARLARARRCRVLPPPRRRPRRPARRRHVPTWRRAARPPRPSWIGSWTTSQGSEPAHRATRQTPEEGLGGHPRTLVASRPHVALPAGLPHRRVVRPRRAPARGPVAGHRRGHPAEQAEPVEADRLRVAASIRSASAGRRARSATTCSPCSSSSSTSRRCSSSRGRRPPSATAPSASIVMLAFIILLLDGLLYAWKRGLLRWV